jgi:hypothetical protein
MKNLKTPLVLFGLIYFIYGFVMNMRMFTQKMWPTYIFFISMGIGILFFAINKPTKRLPNFRVWQLIIGLLPITVFYIQMKVRDYNYPTQTVTVQNELYSNNSLKNGDIIFQT